MSDKKELMRVEGKSGSYTIYCESEDGESHIDASGDKNFVMHCAMQWAAQEQSDLAQIHTVRVKENPDEPKVK